MREYSFTEARQHFASLLEAAKQDGIVCIRKRDGEAYYLQPVIPGRSALDVAGVDLNLDAQEIVDLVRAGRERDIDIFPDQKNKDSSP